jgi:glutamyl-tRNA synthetase
MTDAHHELARLLFPHIHRTPQDWLAHYPPRALPEGARVTRFAPSPTGFVHIGSVMTSLVSRRIAHQTGGVFILRIEDTDKKREQDGSVEAIVRNLIKFDLQPDEGIVQVEPELERGDYAPYTQSERLEQYETFARDLVARGLAYPAFDTEEELEHTRKLQEAQRVRPGTYGPWARWRNASLDEVRARLDAGDRPVIRIRAPYPAEGRVRLDDAVKGVLDLPVNDQDAVLLKSGNRLPTYHFAHVVDDTLMRVNLIIRGDEWLPSAPLHLQLFEYLGQPLPTFAHVAPIAKMDGVSKRKLSKRKDPEANVAYYDEMGYPVQAVTEYLLNLANSDFYDWRKAHPADPNSAFEVRLEKMGVASPLFDPVKLNDISKDVVATYTAEQVYAYGLRWAQEYSPKIAAALTADPAYSLRVFNVERTGEAPRKDIVNWSDIERACGFFFEPLFDEACSAGYPFPKLDPAVIDAILERMAAFDFAQAKDEWIAGMREFGEGLGFARDVKTYKKDAASYKGHFGDVMMVVRVALAAKTNTPDLYEILHTLGAQRVADRLARARAWVQTQPT